MFLIIGSPWHAPPELTRAMTPRIDPHQSPADADRIETIAKASRRYKTGGDD
jgi:hypothetical protein